MSQEQLIAPSENHQDTVDRVNTTDTDTAHTTGEANTACPEAGSTRHSSQVGHGLILDIIETGQTRRATLYRGGTFIKTVDLNDAPAKRLFVTEVVELGAIKLRLAEAVGLSRQTIDNYLDIKHHFGVEGLIHNYNPSKSKKEQRQEQADKQAETENEATGNKARLLEEMRRQERAAAAELERQQKAFDFSFQGEGKAAGVAPAEQPFAEEHDWRPSRYAGVFPYIITLIKDWGWLRLIMGHFGLLWGLFTTFLLMAGCNIRSIEQLKNITLSEAATVLGLNRLPSPSNVREWLYKAAEVKISAVLCSDFFRHQLRAGLVSFRLWATDGHALPYAGQETVREVFVSQRKQMQPGRVNLVTCDANGRVVDFEIQEGQGDLRARISEVIKTWDKELPARPISVFDREGHGKDFFGGLVKDNIPFVTWDKNVAAAKLAAIPLEKFAVKFEFNDKKYGAFEEEKEMTTKDGGVVSSSKGQTFVLRHIYIYNETSERRACGLAWTGERDVSLQECAEAILTRWGASENTFKHMKARHPLNYQPGFTFVESGRQDIANPEIKTVDKQIKGLEKEVGKLYKEQAHTDAALNQDGTPRVNSRKVKLDLAIAEKEADIADLRTKKSTLPERMDVTGLEDYESFKQLDNEGKYLFDFALAAVWNARQVMVDWLRPIFKNDNEVVDVFYAITHCHGWVKCTETAVIVRLEPLQQPKRRAAQEQLCRHLTNLQAMTPAGKLMIIEVGESPLAK